MNTTRGVRHSRRAYLFVLMGPSGVGKSTVSLYIGETVGAEAAPKYTTRPSRNTEEDRRSFIFCGTDGFPDTGILRFESYGHLFGIQLDEIASSLKRHISHVVIVDNCRVASQLASLYRDDMIPIFVFCQSRVLKRRVLDDLSSGRAKRWPQICREISQVYDHLGCAEFIIDNSGSRQSTLRQIERLVSRL